MYLSSHILKDLKAIILFINLNEDLAWIRGSQWKTPALSPLFKSSFPLILVFSRILRSFSDRCVEGRRAAGFLSWRHRRCPVSMEMGSSLNDLRQGGFILWCLKHIEAKSLAKMPAHVWRLKGRRGHSGRRWQRGWGGLLTWQVGFSNPKCL